MPTPLLFRLFVLDRVDVEESSACLKGGFVKQSTICVKQADVLFAHRETASDLWDRKFWAILAGLVLLVALAGPFHTMEMLGLVERLIYWATVGIASALMMWVLNRVLGVLLPQHWSHMATGALAGGIGVLPVMGVVALGNMAAGLGLPQAGFWGFLPYVAPTVIGISMLVHMLVSTTDRNTPVPAQVTATGLFARLPRELGRDIIAMQAQDHYVNVTTPRGNCLILMRMSDATQDLVSLSGMQIHRSWWVNLDHVCKLERTAANGIKLILTNGACVPVPRSRQSEVRQAISAHKLREA